MKYSLDRFAFHLFVASMVFLIFGYGVAVGLFRIYPYPLIVDAAEGYVEFCTRNQIGEIGRALPWYYTPLERPYPPAARNTDEAHQGLNLVSQISTGRVVTVKIMDMEGKTLHQWDVDWFKIWPDAKHVPYRYLPKSPPGTHAHGCMVLENGDLMYNYEHLGLVRLDREGNVAWRLPYQTHHSIERNDNGNFWVCGQKEHTEPCERFPNQIPPFVEDTILEVTPEGKIAREWSVGDLLRKNDLDGLLYLGSLKQWSTQVFGDVLHLNDIEPFPADMEEGFFKHGDLAISMRNINTIFVFNPDTEKIKFLCVGWFIRQHDPDFIDGNRFSVFDNNLSAPDRFHPQSRIAIVSAPDNTATTYYEGTSAHPFYTYMMGKHQWLPNGDLLITESCKGRAFEINPKGEIVWEYVNYVDDGVAGLIDEVQRLAPEYGNIFSAPTPSESESETASPVPARASSAETNASGGSEK